MARKLFALERIIIDLRESEVGLAQRAQGEADVQADRGDGADCYRWGKELRRAVDWMPSFDPEASSVPSGENDTDSTASVESLTSRGKNGAVKWIDRAIALVAPFAKRICLRADTGFSLTRHFDRWPEKVDFVFGMDAYRGLVKIAKSLSQSDWEPFERQPKYQVKTSQRQKRENVKARIIRER